MSLRIGAEDQDTVNEGRTEKLKDVDAPLYDQIVQKLLKKLKEQGAGHRVVELWHSAEAQRQGWLDRQRKLEEELDEFIDPIYAAPQDWMSTLHAPTSLLHAKTYHARMFSASFAQDPPFTARARRGSNAERVALVEDLMRYTLRDWANCYKGIEEQADRGIWSWVSKGSVVWKTRWERKFTKFVDAVQVPNFVNQITIDPNTGLEVVVPVQQGFSEEELERTVPIFEGPRVDRVFLEDINIIGGEGDIDEADAVLEQTFWTASDMWQMVDQKIFDEEAVQKIIAAGRDPLNGASNNTVKAERAERAGFDDVHQEYQKDRYRIIEAYLKIDVDGSGIDSDVVIWVHAATNSIVRATYLQRIAENGKRPYAKADFYKRDGQPFGMGLPELIYTLTKEIDAQRNMRIDFGLLSTMPFGYYRPTSSMSTEQIPIQPGQLIPLDNPTSDVYFPNLGNRTSFGFQEEQALNQMIERVTSISDLSLGVLSAQGAARTATGARAIVGESNSNLDIYLRRLNRGLKKLYSNLFGMLQRRLPAGFEFRLFGDDGKQYFRTIKSREEITGQFDFELEPNSANSNKSIQMDVADQIVMMTSNPLDIQLGIVTPTERYEALKHKLQVMGIKDIGRFLRKPNGPQRVWTPVEVADMVLAGINIPLGPEQDLQGIAAFIEEFITDDMLSGQFNEAQIRALAAKKVEAEQMMQALQAMQAQQANAQQMQRNADMATLQTAPGGGPMAGAPAPGDGGMPQG